MSRVMGLRIDAKDERASLVVHEGQHVRRFQTGMTIDLYQRSRRAFEREANQVGGLVNEASGSDSRYCLTQQQQC